MKELSIGEKAKRYDEALKVLHKYDGVNIMFTQDLKEEMFPELKESEDERMKKSLKRLIAAFHDCNFPTPEGFTRKELFAYLEKQGEHANFRNKIQIGDKVTRNEDGVLVNLSQLNRVAKKDEKQGEQKSDTDFSDLRTWKYIVDAVLTEREGIGQYLGSPWTTEVAEKLQKRFGTIEQKPVEPQQDMLSQEQYAKAVDECIYGEKPAEWSKDDEKMLDYLHVLIVSAASDKNREKLDNWLKSLKNRVLPQQQEWSKEDIGILIEAVSILENYGHFIIANKLKSFHQKLPNVEKIGKNWKPTKEQIEALDFYVRTAVDKEGVFGKEVINLYKQLKAL